MPEVTPLQSSRVFLTEPGAGSCKCSRTWGLCILEGSVRQFFLYTFHHLGESNCMVTGQVILYVKQVCMTYFGMFTLSCSEVHVGADGHFLTSAAALYFIVSRLDLELLYFAPNEEQLCLPLKLFPQCSSVSLLLKPRQYLLIALCLFLPLRNGRQVSLYFFISFSWV